MNKKIGIIDVGGGMKGIYGAGIFDGLLDRNIEIPYCIGISAGSANVASYIAKQKGRNKVFYEEYSQEKNYMSLHNLRTKGSFIDLDYVYGTLSNDGGKYPWDYDSAMKSSQEMVTVMSNAQTGEAEYFYKKETIRNDYGMLKASSCIPVACKAYSWHGNDYYDGSLTDPMPVEKAFEDGCEKVILVLTRPIDYRKKTGKDSVLYKYLKKKYPNMVPKMYDRCNLYNRSLDNIIEKYLPTGKVFIVAPDDTCGVETLKNKSENLEKLYQKGYSDSKKIEDFIKKIN